MAWRCPRSWFRRPSGDRSPGAQTASACSRCSRWRSRSRSPSASRSQRLRGPQTMPPQSSSERGPRDENVRDGPGAAPRSKGGAKDPSPGGGLVASEGGRALCGIQRCADLVRPTVRCSIDLNRNSGKSPVVLREPDIRVATIQFVLGYPIGLLRDDSAELIDDPLTLKKSYFSVAGLRGLFVSGLGADRSAPKGQWQQREEQRHKDRRPLAPPSRHKRCLVRF